MGTLGDRIGRRRLLLIGAVAFGSASVLAAFSRSAEMLIAAGAAIGPLAGGVLLEFFWWGSVFLLAVPVMALLLVLGPILLPEFRDPDAGRMDLISAAMSLISVLAVIYGLKQVAQDGVGAELDLTILDD
jgi:MFS transporter, DHA2 family, multidrug resistance protein